MTVTAIPVIYLPPACFGAMGITLSAKPGAETNAAHADDKVIPIRTVHWMDERKLCTRAHDLLEEVDYDLDAAGVALFAAGDKDLGEHSRCPSYRIDTANGWRGVCGAVGFRAPCLFEEDPADAGSGWAGCATFRRLPDGSLCYAEDLAALSTPEEDLPA